jgi:hypothetical protein
MVLFDNIDINYYNLRLHVLQIPAGDNAQTSLCSCQYPSFAPISLTPKAQRRWLDRAPGLVSELKSSHRPV